MKTGGKNYSKKIARELLINNNTLRHASLANFK